MKNAENLLVQTIENKLYITLNRPEARNALDKSLITNLIQLLKKTNKNKAITAICLKGSDQFFCAGADLTEMKASIKLSKQQNIKHAELLSTLFQSLYNLDKPTLAVAQGGVYGGGLGLIACCDIVIAEKNTQFCFSEAKLGLIPALISPYIIKSIGERQAKKLFLTAEVFTAETAKQINLVHEVVNNKSLTQLTEKSLDNLSRNSLPAMTNIKKLFSPINITEQKKLVKLLADIRTSPDAQKRLLNFLK